MKPTAAPPRFIPVGIGAGAALAAAAPARRPAWQRWLGARGRPRWIRGEERFLSGVRAARLNEGTPRASWALTLMLGTVALAVGWSMLARVDEITRADGRIVPAGREQVIASLEGGILRALMVREGMTVAAGQDLVQLDPTRFESQQNEGQAKRQALKGTVARLTAEAAGRPLAFPPELHADSPTVLGETESYRARQQSLNEGIAVSRRSLVLLQSELQVADGMARKGLLSDVEVMRLRRQVNDQNLQIQERINRFRQEASSELVRVRTELAQLEETMVAREDALRRTTLRSPVAGIVKNIRMNTLGGVVPAGGAILEIVPMSQGTLIEARIKPQDIGFVRLGQSAEVKLSAYDYNTYGGLKGQVEYISPDALGDPERGAQQDATYYRALLRITATTLQAAGKPLPVIPGMTATVEVRTGERSVLSYLVRPMLKSREAFRER